MDRRRLTDALVLATLVLPWAWLVHRYWFVCDDAFITFRYSRNWALGHGPRYNLGDHVPVEGYSNFLWMAIAALVEAVGAKPALVMPWLSVACSLATLGLTWHLLRGPLAVSREAAWAGTLVLATFPPFAVWSTSGLASAPQALAMLGAWMALSFDADDRRAGLVGGLAAIVLALVRTEGIAWVGVIVVIAALQRRLAGERWATRTAWALGLVVPAFALFEVWRFATYGDWVSNTAHAKVHLGAESLWRGVRYVLLYVLTLLSPIAIFAALPMLPRAPNRPGAAGAALLAIAFPAYAIAVSGDYMTWFRLLMPGAPFLAATLGVGLHVGTEGPARRWTPVIGLALATLSLLPVFDVHVIARPVREGLQVREKLEAFRSENEQWAAMVEHTDNWAEKGRALNRVTEPGESFVAGAIGNVGYYAPDLVIFDRNGLVTREVAQQPWDGTLRSPGHDKTVDTTWFLPWKPDIWSAIVFEGPALKPKAETALAILDAEEAREHGYAPVVEVLREKTRRHPPKVIVLVRRMPDAEAVDAAWAAYPEAIAAATER